MDRMPLGKLHRWLACGRFHDSTRASLRDQRPQTNLPLFFGIALIGSSTKRDQTKTKTTHVWLPMTIPRCHWFFPKKLCSLAGATASHTDASSISHHSKKNSTRRTRHRQIFILSNVPTIDWSVVPHCRSDLTSDRSSPLSRHSGFQRPCPGSLQGPPRWSSQTPDRRAELR